MLRRQWTCTQLSDSYRGVAEMSLGYSENVGRSFLKISAM